jgi:hypothetical protein
VDDAVQLFHSISDEKVSYEIFKISWKFESLYIYSTYSNWS